MPLVRVVRFAHGVLPPETGIVILTLVSEPVIAQPVPLAPTPSTKYSAAVAPLAMVAVSVTGCKPFEGFGDSATALVLVSPGDQKCARN